MPGTEPASQPTAAAGPAASEWNKPTASAPSRAAPPARNPNDLPRLIIYMRLINVGLCIIMSAAAVLALLELVDIPTAVLACYVWAFSCMLFCFETQLKFIATIINDNFGFLFSARGRTVFLLFISFLCFSLGILGLIAGILMILNACFNFYVILRYPEYVEMQRINLETQTANYLKNNPNVARQAAASAGTQYTV